MKKLILLLFVACCLMSCGGDDKCNGTVLETENKKYDECIFYNDVVALIKINDTTYVTIPMNDRHRKTELIKVHSGEIIETDSVAGIQ